MAASFSLMIVIRLLWSLIAKNLQNAIGAKWLCAETMQAVATRSLGRVQSASPGGGLHMEPYGAAVLQLRLELLTQVEKRFRTLPPACPPGGPVASGPCTDLCGDRFPIVR
ncbi:uncharacterized protein PGTG_20854 [Puccinia graminis f. sp. tritici CRL 75-36-700-3]|uniref:Secreted protein n=1 Tax=Puccinia graminis f. sp. tritici (strain CRL 75-36-700-3 / race SCCL) TaxID=418459 RepID=H6QPI7_PUCGT|nr:uncharacterized protein PGTG_20854 [Puccinia graminis f. sp. tritici CRL 75-36-700-3]EHS63872.1 hypothetical protein PGTG_20854 [Puccinia graminis f. sp. tritici CRL 75-36-700-3]